MCQDSPPNLQAWTKLSGIYILDSALVLMRQNTLLFLRESLLLSEKKKIVNIWKKFDDMKILTDLQLYHLLQRNWAAK